MGITRSFSELEKLRLTFAAFQVDQIKEFVISGRIYSIFELVDRVSSKKCADSLEALGRYLQEEDKRVAPLQVIGILNWQIRLLWQTKSVLAQGGGFAQVAEKLSESLQSRRSYESGRALVFGGTRKGASSPL
jgi:DNA polymerase III delta subunit